MSSTSLPSSLVDALARRFAREQEAYISRYPGDSGARQPAHSVIIGAHELTADLARRFGDDALRAVADHAPDATTFADAVGVEGAHAEAVYERVLAKLRREPVEDLCLDFEEGYGVRSDAEEDHHAVAVAEELARAYAAGSLPPFTSIRVKPLTAELGARAVRTVDLFVSTLVRRAGRLPTGFVVMLAKITSADQVAALAEALEALEAPLALPAGALRLALMIETTQCILDADGRSMLPKLLDAARGRCVAAHLGTYDYTAGNEITAAHQRMRHPACDFAKHMMKVAYAGTGVWLSDGSTNVLPVGDTPAVHAAWRLHADDVRHSLVGGFYQGWDLHPAQLPSRFGALYGFFLSGLAAATARLRRFVARLGEAAPAGEIFDDAATGQALLSFFLRGLACGAITEDEALATGLTREELRGRSFAKVLRGRRGS